MPAGLAATINRMWAAARRVAPIVLLRALPLLVLALGAYRLHHTGNLGTDFRLELYPEAKQVLDWTNPYPSIHSDLSSGPNEVFPVPAALLVSPLTFLSAQWAAWVEVARSEQGLSACKPNVWYELAWSWVGTGFRRRT